MRWRAMPHSLPAKTSSRPHGRLSSRFSTSPNPYSSTSRGRPGLPKPTGSSEKSAAGRPCHKPTMSGEVRVDSVPHLQRALAESFESAARTALPLEWAQIDFFWVDERCVPPTHPDSNFGLAYTYWLGPAKVPAARTHRMPGEAPDQQEAAWGYSAELVSLAGSPPQIDFVVLGVGPDGHIASLFPGHPILNEPSRLVAVVEDAPKPPPRRLTLTLPALCHARALTVIATGESKAEAIRLSLEPGSDLPLGRLSRCTSQLTYLLDKPAASRLPKR